MIQSRVSRVPTLLGYQLGAVPLIAYGTFTLSMCGPFQPTSANSPASHIVGPTTPDGVPPGLGLVPVRSPLLTGVSVDFFSSGY